MERFKEQAKEDDEIKEKLMELFANEQNKNEYYSKEKQGQIAQTLQELHQEFGLLKSFNIGDIILWKKGLKNKKRPYLHEPAIVVDILDSPIFDERQDSGSPYFNEPLDMVIGIADYEKDDMISFLLFYVDKRRFQLLESKRTEP